MATENSPRLSARDQLLTVTSAARGLVKTADNSVRNKLLLDDRRAALTLGRFNHSSYPVDMWQSPKLKLVVFFSSTFTDTYHERNTLMMEILKELRDIALPHGIPVTFVDMRWGVRDENTKDHLTWFECARELARCREESWGVSFVSLQSEKYGYCPAPRTIESNCFEERLANSNSTEDDINIAKQWYTLDENALPSVYVLRNLERIDDETYWKVVLPTLTRLFDGIPFDQSCWKLLTNRSVTEWEVTAAAESEPDKSRLFWMRRTFQGGVTKEYPRYWDYSDVLDDELKASRLSSLLKWMEEKVFLSEQIYNYSDASIKSYCSDDDIWKVQKERWTKEMTSILKNSLDLIIKTGKEWLKNSCGLDIPGEEATEMLHHCAWAARKAADFVGRDELVDSLLNSIATNNRILPSDLQDDGFDGVSVCVVGRSGCGKTALMAKVADLLSMQQQLEADEDEDFIRPIIIRFCGTSPGSSTGLSMVRSICRQIHFCLGDNLNETAKDVLSMSYNEVVSYFHDLLRDNVVVLFIDSIDQLSNADLARSNVSFLDGVIPHQDTRIIVSVLPDEKDPVTGKWIYLYGSETKLMAAEVPRIEVDTIGSGSISNVSGDNTFQYFCCLRKNVNLNVSSEETMTEGESIIETLLARKNRCITTEQMEYVMQQVSVEPTALYLSLAVRIMETWTSTTTRNELMLAGGVRNLISQIFNTIERDYGRELTRAVLAFITLSVDGITDVEMCDLLTLVEDVMNSINQYNQSIRCPDHVWLRLRAALWGLITERDGNRLGWYHRQLWETASEIFTVEEKQKYHIVMARYFGNILPPEIVLMKGITSQPLVLLTMTSESDNDESNHLHLWKESAGNVVNRRRCVESVHHMLKGGLLVEAENEVCSLVAIRARAVSGVIYSVVGQLTDLSRRSPSDRVRHYLRWVQKDAYMINRSLNALFASCAAQPSISIPRKEATEFLSSTYLNPTDFSLSAIVTCEILNGSNRFDPCLCILSGHTHYVTTTAWNLDGSKVVSASGDPFNNPKDYTIRVWDVLTGAELISMEGHSGIISRVVWSPVEDILASSSHDKSVKLWDALSGATLATLEGHTSDVYDVAWNHSGLKLASSSLDLTIRIWDVKSCTTLLMLEGGHSKGITSISWNPNDDKIVSSSADASIRIWNSMTAEVLFSEVPFPARGDRVESVTCVSWSPLGDYFAVTGNFCYLLLCTASGEHVDQRFTHGGSYIHFVSWSSDGKYILTCGNDNSCMIWDCPNLALIKKLVGHSGSTSSAAWSYDMSKIVSASDDKTLRVWEAPRGSESDQGDDEGEEEASENETGYISQIRYSPDGTKMLMLKPELTKIIDVESNKVLATKMTKSSQYTSYSIDFSKVAYQLSAWNGDKREISLEIWDSYTNNSITVDGLDFFQMGMSPDGFKLCTACKETGACIRDCQTGKVLSTFSENLFGESPVSHVVWNPNGSNILLSDFSDTLRLWESLPPHNMLWSLPMGYTDISFNPSGTKFVTEAGIWDISNQELILNFNRNNENHEVVNASWNNDGSYISMSARDNKVRIYNVETCEIIVVLEGHTGLVHCVAFNPLSNNKVMTLSTDLTMRVWSTVRLV